MQNINLITNSNIISKTLNTVCKLFGHTWLYKDYTNWIKENGDHYDFKAARRCTRCKQNEYLYDTWKADRKNVRYDVQGDSRAVKEIGIFNSNN